MSSILSRNNRSGSGAVDPETGRKNEVTSCLYVGGIKIEPKEVHFYNSVQGRKQTRKITFQNIAFTTVHVAVFKPDQANLYFSDHRPHHRYLLFPGLVITKHLTYNSQNTEFESSIRFLINAIKITLPIFTHKSVGDLRAYPECLDFGVLNLGGKYSCREVTLVNNGTSPTKWSIIIGASPLQVLPKYGYLKPQEKALVRFRAVGVKLGPQKSTVWFECSDSESRSIDVIITSIAPSLMIYHPVRKGSMTVLSFGVVYYGTCVYESFIIRNYSGEPTTYVLAVTLQQKQTHKIIFTQLGDCKVKKWLHIWPFEGNLEPFESRVFTVCFRPVKEIPVKGWKHQSKDIDKDLWSFLHVEEVSQKPPSDDYDDSQKKGHKKLNIPSIEKKEASICVHGEAEEPDILCTPRCIKMTIPMGEQSSEIIKLTNASSHLPIHFEFTTVPFVTTEPKIGILKPSQSMEVLFTFRAKSLGSLDYKLIYKVKSFCNMSDQEDMITLKKKAITLHLYTVSKTKHPEPKYIQGITPYIANEVGYCVEKTKFTSDLTKLPRAALVSLDKRITRKPWFLDDANTIAFPNDMAMAKSVKHPYDETKRSIFTGAPRYMPPSKPDEALTDMEIHNLAKRNYETRKFIKSFVENQLTTVRSDIKDDNLFKERLHELLKKATKCTIIPQLTIPFNENKTKLFTSSLTPHQLYNIYIRPSSFNFGLIPVGVECHLVLTFQNLNPFPVKMEFELEDKLKFPKSFELGAMSTLTRNLYLKLSFNGKFLSIFHYVICNIHDYYKTVRAEAVQPFIKFSPSILEFSIPKHGDIYMPCYESIVIKNPFSLPTSFEWMNIQRHIIEVIPERGEIRENDSITCLVYVYKFFKKRKRVSIKLASGNSVVNILTCYIPPFVDYNIVPISPVINMKILPAGTKVIKKAYLFNYGCYSTSYWVKSSGLVDGVEIHPKCGVIPPKSLETLEIHLHFRSVMMLNFALKIEVEYCCSVTIQVIGSIIYPMVSFKPKELSFLTTKCYSISTQSLKITNETSQELYLNFRMKKFVQFKITLSPFHYDQGLNGEVLKLKPETSQIVYIHFKPLHIAAYEFYLPICINGLLGPPKEKNSNRSGNFMSIPQLSSFENQRKVHLVTNTFNIPLQAPEYFDAVWVRCCVQSADLAFSSLEINLETFGPNLVATKKIYLTNPTKEPISVQIAKAKPPFSLFVDESLSPYKIEPKGTLEVVIKFSAVATGSWSTACPVSLLKNDTSIFYNDLILSGICHPSTLYCPTTELYFIPVPLGTRLDKKIELHARYQRKETEIKTYNYCKTHNIDRKIGIDFPESNRIPKNVDGVIIPVTISFLSMDVTSFEVKLVFRDGLEGEVEVIMFATATDSLIPNHWFYFSIHYEDVSQQSGTAIYKATATRSGSMISKDSMFRRVVGWRDSELTEVIDLKNRFSTLSTLTDNPCLQSEISPWEASNAEDGFNIYYWSKIYNYVMRWLLYCVFNGSYQPKLEDIPWSQGYMEQSKLKSNLPTRTFIDLIIALFGSEILAKTNITSEMPPNDKMLRINHCLRVYSKILSYLEVYGVGLSHISPLYLLNYEDYSQLYEWKDNRVSGSLIIELPPTMKSKKEFEYFGRKMWLELYLQLFKIHTLDTCVGLAVIDDWPRRNATAPGIVSISGHHAMTFDKISPITKIITGDMLDQVSQDKSHSEAVLLAWLSRTYNKVRGDAIMHLPPMDDDKILDLGPSLRSGVVLAGVTAYYCPFLVDILSNLSLDPVTPEEIFSNANYLILAWDEVKLGLMMKSEDLVECNPIFMMMLVAYLYLSLPNFIPTYLLRAAVPLGDAGTSKLFINNESMHELRYYVKLYQDSNEPFTVVDQKPMYIIKPKHTIDVCVHFISNRISKVSGMLLFCGVNGPKIHGVNLCIRLEGEPTTIKVSNKIVIKLPLYEQIFLHQKIYSPYAKRADYTVTVSTEKPSLEKTYLKESQIRKDCLIPMQLVVGSKQVVIPPHPRFGMCEMSCCSLVNVEAVRWMVFSSPVAGDFVCKVILKPYPEKNPKKILVEVPVHTSEKRSSHHEESFIPIDINIPSTNTSLINASLDVLSLIVSSDEVYFYKKYWGRYIGFKLFEMEIIENCPDFAIFLKMFFDHTVTYLISCDSSLIEVQKTITIKDTYKEGDVILPIRLKSSFNKPFSALLTLSLADNQEVRSYRLHFVPKYEKTAPDSK